MLSSSLFTVVLALASSLSVSATDKVFSGDTGVTLLDYQPAFTSPSGGENWAAGSVQSASWSQTLPSGVSEDEVASTADIKLGYKTDDSSSLNLYWTLATNVSLYAPAPNSVSFTLPTDLETRDSYILVLLGSTGAQSAEFTITGTEHPVSSTVSAVSGAVADIVGGASPTPLPSSSSLFVRKVRRSSKARLDN